MGRKIEDLTGKVFGRIEVLSFSHKDQYGARYWNCRCLCTVLKTIRGASLKAQKTKSCGYCEWKGHRGRKTTHGGSSHPLFGVWKWMKSRCLDPKKSNFKNYGGRGITVCVEWLDFENFYKDMGERPEGTTLDRIDSNKGYYKENCRWATHYIQQNNRRNNKKYTYKGKTLSRAQWSRELNMKYGTLRQRLEVLGWSVERALTVPVRFYKK